MGKRIFLKCALFALTFFSAANCALATLTDDSVSPDLTLTDINGNSFNLYQELGAGKTVFLEFVAAWNDNCWNYHNAQHLQTLYAQHGPQGSCSDDVIVVLIEADLTTDMDFLDGTSPASAGNWIGNTPYPIFNPESDDVIDDFLVTTFPTIYRICPSKFVKSNGQISATAHVESINSCGITNDISIEESSAFVFCANNVEPVVNIGNVALPLTLTTVLISYFVDDIEQPSVNWSGNVAPGQQVSFTLPSMNLTEGIHEIRCSITNLADNSVDLNLANNCLTFFVYVSNESIDITDVNQDFSNSDFPYTGWTSDNSDLSNTWQHISHEGGMMMMDFFTYGDLDAFDILHVGPVEFAPDNSPYLSFDVAYAPYSANLYDALVVAVSSDCGQTWTEVYSKEGQELATAEARTDAFYPLPGNWRSECAFLGGLQSSEDLRIAFIGFNGWGNNLFIDNINLGNSCIVGDEDISVESFSGSVYPNPANDRVTISNHVFSSEKIKCSLFSMTGELVYEFLTANRMQSESAVVIECSDFDSGVYLLRVTCEDKEYSTQLVIMH